MVYFRLKQCIRCILLFIHSCLRRGIKVNARVFLELQKNLPILTKRAKVGQISMLETQAADALLTEPTPPHHFYFTKETIISNAPLL